MPAPLQPPSSGHPHPLLLGLTHQRWTPTSSCFRRFHALCYPGFLFLCLSFTTPALNSHAAPQSIITHQSRGLPPSWTCSLLCHGSYEHLGNALLPMARTVAPCWSSSPGAPGLSDFSSPCSLTQFFIPHQAPSSFASFCFSTSCSE